MDIAEVAQRSGIPASTLRFYEAEGLLSPSERSEAGYRLYDTYCAACHGDDGRGVHPEDLLPPATKAPVIGAATVTRAAVAHVLGLSTSSNAAEIDVEPFATVALTHDGHRWHLRFRSQNPGHDL